MIRILGTLVLGIVLGGVGYVVANETLALQTGTPAHGAGDGHSHAHAAHAMIDIPAKGAPTIRISAQPDPETGWNLHAETANFAFAPAQSGTTHIPGQGHAHIYVNGHKLARLYGNWFHLADLPTGKVDLRVGLYSNDHRMLSVAGTPIADSITLFNQP
ncbi:hypothetical protein [Phaeobacter sp. J2-8]|uniref:hypothetical protein n=1 Tax=Phaeobacter sp. J2-8 TaxID=2931394 RepID=UPI001FD35AA5|nr:hypothetical protein [Phaeobacter sp. J2-8]MCJ7873885.1 hypothetical protein [Phaeobacter sp. J2-8]